MKVRMRTTIIGTRNGADWPPIGETMELPDAEGAELCANGFAEPVKAAKAVETADAPAVPARKRTPKAKA